MAVFPCPSRDVPVDHRKLLWTDERGERGRSRYCESAGKVTPGRRSKGPPFPAGRLGCKPMRALSQPCHLMGAERQRFKRHQPACGVCAVTSNGGVARAGRPGRRCECREKPTDCLSHARIRAAVRHCRVRKDQAYISPPACVRSQTPRDCRGGCRAMPDTHPGGEAECVPHPASAALGSGGPAAVGNAPAPAVAVPCGAPDNAVVAVRWSKPWSLSTVT